MMRCSVITFPGSNCDRDMRDAVASVTGCVPDALWHADSALPKQTDVVILPGGFSYGDYLRCGAMAARSPLMQDVKRHADAGGYVLGVCNGFQMLTEANILPGVLLRNKALKFICKDVRLNVKRTDTAFTSGYTANEIITIPIAHHDGNYFADEDTLARLRGDNRIAFTYADNPNGSKDDIAGIFSENGRVLGMMPHPERATDPVTGGTDGAMMFRSILEHITAHAA